MADYFKPYEAAFVENPYPVYRRLRDEDPILQSAELGLTLFSRYHDILAILRDERFGRAFDRKGAQDVALPSRRRGLPHYRRFVDDNLLEHEGETHTRLRCIFARSLSPERINYLGNRIRHLAAEQVSAAVERRRFDFLDDIAVPLTVTVIAELLGWPAPERHRLRPWSARIVRLYEKDCTENDEIEADNAAREFGEMVSDLADQRKRQPRDDVISSFVALEAKGDLRSRDELISSCMLLLNAGHEATVNASGNGLLALLRHPRQMDLLKNDPELMPGAIEEMLRYESPLHLFHRYVLADLDFHGIALQRGDTVGLLYGSANRDPAMFADPDTFDIRRRPNRHLAFGAGDHFCFGAPLARQELTAIFSELLKQIPALQLAEQPRYRAGLVFRGLTGLKLSC